MRWYSGFRLGILIEEFLSWFQKYILEKYTQKQLDKQYSEIKEGKETWQD